MQTKKIIWIGVAVVLTAAAVLDAVRYLKPEEKDKRVVGEQGTLPTVQAKEIILVYNAWGGIYPGLADFVHKEVFPSSYPCNLCYQTFGTFRMKPDWRAYLDSLPFRVIELHKDNYKNSFQPEDLPLPVILLGNNDKTDVLLSAAEINSLRSLEALKEAVSRKLLP